MKKLNFYLLIIIVVLSSCKNESKHHDGIRFNTIKLDSLFIDEESPMVLMHWNEQLESGVFRVNQKKLSYRYNRSGERTFIYDILGDTPDQLKGGILLSMAYRNDSTTFVDGIISTNIYDASGALIHSQMDIEKGIQKSMAFPAFNIGDNVYRSSLSTPDHAYSDYAIWKFDLEGETYQPYLKFPEEVATLKDDRFFYTFKRVGDQYWMIIPGLPHIYIYEVVENEIELKTKYEHLITKLSDQVGKDLISMNFTASIIVPMGDLMYVGYKVNKDRDQADKMDFEAMMDEGNFKRAHFYLRDGEIVGVGKGDRLREKYRNLYPLSDGSFWGIERNVEDEDPDLQNKYYLVRFEVE
ncbi:MAG: hypothetical protein LAT68_08145 [Cyclobacteriaceae bacterium]|nr:hypothetical protein [Cyclobacteriaceae bacterium]MCH8516285.1 hypothetical protein [Cyclobacteriaceae bacterium]